MILSSFTNKLKTRKPSLISNTISNMAGLAITTILHLLLTPIIILYLGKETYGAWIIIISLLEYFGFLDFGITSAIERYVSRYIGQNNRKAMNETINSGLVIFLVVGCVVIVGSFLSSSIFVQFFKVPPALMIDFRNAFIVLGLSVGISFPGGVFASILKGYEKFFAVNLVYAGTAILRTGLILLVLYFDLHLFGMAASYLLVGIIAVILFYFISRKTAPFIQINFRLFRMSIAKFLLGYGVSTSLIELSCILRFQLDSAVIGRMLDLSGVAVFGIAALFMTYFIRIITTFTHVLFPRLSKLDGKNDRVGFMNIFSRSMHIVSVFACTFAVVLMFGGFAFIDLWVGVEFWESYKILAILLIGYIVSIAQSPANTLMFSINKHHTLGIIWIFEGIANVIISLLLAKKFGLIGVAIGTMAPMIVSETIFKPLYICRAVKISLFDYFVTFGKPILLVIPCLPIAYYFSPLLLGLGWIPVGIICSTLGIIYMSVSFVITSSRKDIVEVYNSFRSWVKL